MHIHINYLKMGYAIPIIPPSQRGSGFASQVYKGERRQVGGNLFSTIGRIAMPLLRKLFPVFSRFGKRLGKAALNVGGDMVNDLVSGRASNIPHTFKNRSREEINNISQDYVGQNIFPLSQEGSGMRRKRKAITKKHKRNKSAKIINKSQFKQFSDIFDISPPIQRRSGSK